MCKYKTLRSQLARAGGLISSKNNEPTDCELSNWVTGICSAKCEEVSGEVKEWGGEQILQRQIIGVGNEYGIQCSQFTLSHVIHDCGSGMKCPVDCQVSTWAGWGRCSSLCGGGVRTRVRSVIREPEAGGRRCPHTTQTTSCNTASCDRDCIISRWWSKWSACSRQCGGGVQYRRRKIVQNAIGLGKCYTWSSRYRLEERACNE